LQIEAQLRVSCKFLFPFKSWVRIW